MSYALDPDLLDELERWIRQQEFPPTKTAVLEMAIREFLNKREEKPES